MSMKIKQTNNIYGHKNEVYNVASMCKWGKVFCYQ